MLLWAGGVTWVIILMDDPWPATETKLSYRRRFVFFMFASVATELKCLRTSSKNMCGFSIWIPVLFFLWFTVASSVLFHYVHFDSNGDGWCNLMYLDLNGDLQSLWKLFWVTVYYPSLQFVINYPLAATLRVSPVAFKPLNNMCNCSHGNIKLSGGVTLRHLTP